MSFFVYENWTHKRARVHRGECAFCNQGRGAQAGDSGRNGRWHGPIADRGVAVALASSLHRADTKLCAVCGP